MRTFRYYLAKGRSLAACEEIQQARRAAADTLREICAEMGADNGYGSPRIVGLSFPEGKRPVGWKSYVRNQSRILMPDKRNKDLAPLRKRIEALWMPGGAELHKKLGFDLCISGEETSRGMVILYTSAETIGDKVILKVPVNSDGRIDVPPDAEPLKASEYWRLKEESGEAAFA